MRQRLINTRRRMEELLAGNQPSDAADCFESTEELAAPLLACYRSLWECGAWECSRSDPAITVALACMLRKQDCKCRDDNLGTIPREAKQAHVPMQTSAARQTRSSVLLVAHALRAHGAEMDE